eukprot:UN33299
MKAILKRAQKRNDTRALLVRDPKKENKIHILSDKGLLFHGPEGELFVNLTISAWSKFIAITLPILVVCLLTIILSYHMNVFHDNDVQPKNETIVLTNKEQPTMNTMIIVYGIIFIVIILVALFIMYRCQQAVRQVCRCFLVGDIFVLIALGSFVLTIIPLNNWDLSTDKFGISFACYNFGVVGLLSFYLKTPHYLHCAYLVALFTIMSSLLTFIFKWYVAFCVSLLA